MLNARMFESFTFVTALVASYTIGIAISRAGSHAIVHDFTGSGPGPDFAGSGPGPVIYTLYYQN